MRLVKSQELYLLKQIADGNAETLIDVMEDLCVSNKDMHTYGAQMLLVKTLKSEIRRLQKNDRSD